MVGGVGRWAGSLKSNMAGHTCGRIFVRLRRHSSAPLVARVRVSLRVAQRYDHYCRWLTNVIGLLNHREFFVMLVGLIAIAVAGVGVDAMLMFMIVHKGLMVDEVRDGAALESFVRSTVRERNRKAAEPAMKHLRPARAIHSLPRRLPDRRSEIVGHHPPCNAGAMRIHQPDDSCQFCRR